MFSCPLPIKKSFVEKFMADHKLRADEILFMGDDIPDLEAMSLVGLSACPADAVAEIKTIVKIYFTHCRRQWMCQRCDRTGFKAERSLASSKRCCI